MKHTITRAFIAFLLLMNPAVQSQSTNGTVAFNCPNLPPSEFQFDLDRRVIALVMEDPTSNIAPLFNTIDTLRLRSYRGRSVNLKEVVQYYGEVLKVRGWQVLGHPPQDNVKDDNFHLYTLQVNESLQGIFIIVKSGDDVYLINIVGEIPKKQLGALLLNLHQLGIEIPELMSLKQRDLEIPPPPPLPTPEVVDPTPEPPVTTDTSEEVSPSLQEIQELAKSWNWMFDGEQIHDIQIQGVEGIDSSNIVKILENGSGDVTEVMPILTSVLLNSSKKASLRVEEKGAKRLGIITVEDIPITRTLSVLKSLKISGSDVNRVHNTLSKLVSQGSASQIPAVGTRFLAGDVPIHEIRIQGNQKISDAQIQQTLENSSEDIEQALKTLYKAMPYFEEVNLQINEENSKYIATITVDEKPLSNTYLGLNPPLRLGFNRVTGWEIGTGFELGKRKDIGTLWAWSVRNSTTDQNSKFFGKASYAFGNPHIHYRMGGTANWGKPYIWNLGLTAQIHRLTDAVAPEMFPNYNENESIFQRVFGIPDLQNYYLRQGAELAVRWAPIMPTHAFKLAMVTESHASLQKSTDWFIANWGSHLRVRENPPIIPGQMRSLTFQYDFRTRTNALGWHNTFLIEHSNAAVGSDFDFTRLLLHLRYAFRLQNNRIRTRFLFGFSDSTLPIQRQFVIDGIEGLRGYSWRKQEDESEGPLTYKSGYTSSPYTFAGDRGFLLNIEYHYRLSNLSSWRFFNNAFAIVFFDEGQVWNVSGPAYTFDPKGNIGIGLQVGEDSSIFRLNIARAFESGKGIHVTTVWSKSF
ncbi:hypothetical protein F4X88_14770 [Candidatus Poribacteria bacterium]|nr:hypothetical protein [Candidatus Poribacteria bacterium]MYA57551.1 hypothetical protein [Candidatus Poribacteria bacterium]